MSGKEYVEKLSPVVTVHVRRTTPVRTRARTALTPRPE
jgi:hypothetical protein